MGENREYKIKRAISFEGILVLLLIILLFFLLGKEMDGIINVINTLINTAFDLLLNTVFYILALAVLAGALSHILTEFGIVALFNKLLALFMRRLYGLPGAAALGIVTTYLSDNPAILTLADDKRYRKYFKPEQLPALTNLGTAFGMGLIVTAFMIGSTGTIENAGVATILGNLGAIIGSIISVRIMLRFTRKYYQKAQTSQEETVMDEVYDPVNYRLVRQGSFLERLLDASLEGGKSGVELGLSIIPGVLLICTVISVLTNGPGVEGYTGAAYEGIGLIPKLGGTLNGVIQPLFGFSSPKSIAFPLTAIGSVGAALTLIPQMVTEGNISGNDIAVFTAMGMCWSGYLSTHISMMDRLGARELAIKAIISHTIGGFIAGISAHYLYLLFLLLV